MMRYFLRCLVFLSIATTARAQITSPRERVPMDFDWRFTLGDPQDARKSVVPPVATGGPGATKDASADTGAGSAELAAKTGDAAKGAQDAVAATIFDYPEPGILDKTRLKDREERAVVDAKRVDPVATNLGGDLSYVKPDFDDASWRALDLPHDFIVELPFGNGDTAAANIAHGKKAVDTKAGTNVGWYRHTFDLPASDKGRRLSIEFDGVFRNSLVWLNGKCLGRFNSGYIGFAYDVTDEANVGGRNTLVVRADATRGEGWFYEGGGIYRHVWLVKTSPVHVARWGTFVTSDVKADGVAEVTARTTVVNDGDAPATVQLETRVLGPDGKPAVTMPRAEMTIAPKSQSEVVQSAPVAAARLWSPETPHLYAAVSTVTTGGATADVYDTPFGIRTIKFDAEQGFQLNGKPYTIKGTCNHQDHAGVGSALPDRLQYFRIEKLKEMGGNAYRASHNPPTPELLDACDRLGMLVMDENRRFDDTPEVLGQLEALIKRDRNRPSVFIWCLANEEMDLQRNDNQGNAIAKAMEDFAHAIDPTRPVTIANNGAWKGWRQGFNNIVEVIGVNYFTSEEKNLDQYHADFPNRLLIGSEEASTLTTRGEYTRDDRKGFMSAYDREFPKWGSTAETWWTFYAARPWLSGGFIWTGFDYRGEPTPFNHNFSSQFGVLDTCGFPKDISYYYKAWWSDQPVLHVFPHWNWAGKEGQEIDVWAFSNHEEVELFLNGKSLGRKAVARHSHVEWKVAYAPGVLSATGYRDGKRVDEQKVETTGVPAAIKLTPDRSTIVADGQDVSILTVAVVDAQGRIVPTASDEVRFSVAGPGTIIGVGNGHPNTTESDKEPKRKAFNGLAQVIVRSHRGKPGTINLSATADGLTAAKAPIASKQ